MALTDITSIEVEKAIEECDRRGRDAFLKHYGFRPARRYLLSYEGTDYDSKAIVGAAHGYLPGERPLAAKDFSGGAAHAAGLLRGIGFVVVDTTTDDGADEGRPFTAEDLVALVAKLKVNRSSGAPALYQPITLLWAIGRAHRGEPRLLSWGETEEAVRVLLKRHGMRGERPRPDYPVAALHRAGLWSLPGVAGDAPTAHGDSGLRSWFADNQPVGGLIEPVHDLLNRSGEARLAVIDQLLCRFFDGLEYEELLADVGLYDDGLYDDGAAEDAAAEDPPHPQGRADRADRSEEPEEPEESERWPVEAARYERLCRIVEHREAENHGKRATRTVRNPIRSASARAAVLSRSQGRCENPHCTGQPTDVTDARLPIIEVDHVVGLALGGRDHPMQMVALCPNCHAVKTRGSTREALRAVLLAVAAERHAALSRSAEETQPFRAAMPSGDLDERVGDVQGGGTTAVGGAALGE
ncbi:HNH endonuclease [Streptomyces sp. NPDC014622]|uniref:HNH endonuclease n=1 Tax=Streptomyces sp. NPDC014622 TaxID=3364874 RepID=UPI0036FECF37